MTKPPILSIDAGTTGISVFAFDEAARIVHHTYKEFAQHYPQPGWVEHDADEIWQVALRLVRETLDRVGSDSVAAIGLTNQRETTVLWDRRTGKPVSRAIVWQCRRSESLCRAAIEAGHADLVKQKTGLVIDPYFSATKIQYLLRTNPELRALARHGHLAFGTIDSWLLWNLTGGKVHATDLTNASRTLLLNIHERKWDEALLDLFEVPPTLLPQVLPSVDAFGQTDAAIAGHPIPICGVAGDQQAALFGQTGFKSNDAKVTYGTGAFLVVNCGERCPLSRSGLLTTLACGANGLPVYALEGSVFVAGAAVQWLPTVSASSNPPPKRKRSPAPCPTQAASSSCPHSLDWVHRIGTAPHAAPYSDSPAAPPALTWFGRRLKASLIRWPTCWTLCPPSKASPLENFASTARLARTIS